MTGYEVYSLVLCLIVFTVLTVLSVVVITIITRQTLSLIRYGAEDKKIIDEDKNKKKKKGSKTLDYIVSGILTLVFVFFFCSSMYINCVQNTYFENTPTYKVVKTGSMAKKHEKNTYLEKYNLDDQIQAFDLIATYKLPDEMDLELYDIVVYEVDGVLLVHRIVRIEEPNGEHPNQRYFLCQGDAVESPDRFPVLYSQMKGIYRGERIPAVGSFVLFMQSFAGWLCIMLVAVASIATPIIEKTILKAKQQRLLILKGVSATEEQDVEDFDELEIQEDIVQEVIDTVNAQTESKAFFFTSRDTRHFKQKLIDAPCIIQDRYEQIVSLVSRIQGIRVIEGKSRESFKKGHDPVVRMTFRGKTLCVSLALNPEDYQNTKYRFTDISEFKTHTHYPMRVKLTSDRQVRWAKELINDIITKNGYTLLEEQSQPVAEEPPIDKQSVDQVVSHIAEHKFLEYYTGKSYRKSFGQRLRRSSKQIKQWYKALVSHIKKVENVREIESDHFRTFRLKNKPIAKITMKGKTLNVYLALKPSDFVDTKYIFQDVSHVKKYVYYPMRVKLTSDRQLKWSCELIDKIMQEYLVSNGGVK